MYTLVSVLLAYVHMQGTHNTAYVDSAGYLHCTSSSLLQNRSYIAPANKFQSQSFLLIRLTALYFRITGPEFTPYIAIFIRSCIITATDSIVK
jgi:hypothetical protein